MRIVGIDPGKTGALAHVDLDGMQVLDLVDMPLRQSVEGRDITDPVVVCNLLLQWQPDLIILEHVHPGQGKGQAASWAFATGFGLLIAACQIAAGPEKRLTMSRPAIWKPALGVSTKHESLDLARETFPDVRDMLSRVKDDGRAEALLLTEYHRRCIIPRGEVEVY